MQGSAGTNATGGTRPLDADLNVTQLRAIRSWCRRRAQAQVVRCRDMLPFWLDRQPHEEVRYRLGLTVEEYRRARRWLELAKDRCLQSPEHLGVEDTLREIADDHVELVLRLGLLRQQGATREQAMADLAVGRESYDMALEWWRDAPRRGGAAAGSPPIAA